MRLTQNEIGSKKLNTVACLVVRKDCFVISTIMISTCDAMSHFNDGTKGRYHLLIHKELEQLRHSRKKNNKSDIYQEHFQIKFQP